MKYEFGTHWETVKTIFSNPPQFFKKNKSKKEECITFYAHLIIISELLAFFALFVEYWVYPSWYEDGSIWINVILGALFILFAPLVARFLIWILSWFLNVSTRLVLRIDDRQKARRVVAYSSPSALFYGVPFLGVFISLVAIIYLQIVGIAGQYKVANGTAFGVLIVTICLEVLFLVLLFIIFTVLFTLWYISPFDVSPDSSYGLSAFD